MFQNLKTFIIKQKFYIYYAIIITQQPRCTCVAGYTGLYCETNIDECAPDLKGELPCKNGGKCFDAVNNFTCDCQNTGYTGGNCTEDIDECENSQTDCGHGRCQNLPGSYECICDFGYCGYNCGMLDPCQEVSSFGN